ncbi:MAG: DNA polymerase III subunit epsilon [Xanthobacteraceae bacterium]|nr:DNA polymerase III subunit epsilon [Xanthobacteraceae bacterium]MBX3534875.1 DNA polymerase III subunit epsilon [Xanthobacteraceae bacterium]MBX3549527.1 DNA polymerase III subunit epsilon [Xanthobacteraceae bacterium]MCW5673225.1 DNA polymerase III subunit epsilon [Xanthobacteraceae bacterium]MCW5677662.1 DNA polymerase III subunit epsilon [Xanthobacteraceae bacterium]
MREIVFDTETTGFDPSTGDRVVEIGCVELLNRIPTGATFHAYINPERDMPPQAEAVHGLSEEFLKDKPKFAEVAEAFLEFIGGDSKLVAHNAGFDMTFIDFELKKCGLVPPTRDRVIDTLTLARRKHPGGGNKLDDLCARYGIDNSRRTKHGALLDAELLAEVYAELAGGRQARLGLVTEVREELTITVAASASRQSRQISLLSETERSEHRKFVSTLGEKAVWLDYLSDEKITAAE